MRKLLAALAVAGLLAAGCGGDDDDAAVGDADAPDVGDVDEGGDGAAADEPSIVISGSTFEPSTLQTDGGSVSVTVTNDDSFGHTFTLDDGDVDEPVAGGESVTVNVEVPEGGEVTYHCEIHPSMTGTIAG